MTLVFDTVAMWTDFTIAANASVCPLFGLPLPCPAAYQIDWRDGKQHRPARQALQSSDKRRSAIALRNAASRRCAPHRGQHARRGAGQAHYTVDLVSCVDVRGSA